MMEQTLEREWTEDELEQARQRAREAATREPRIKRATYDDTNGRLSLELMGAAFDGATLGFPARSIPGFEGATDTDLREFIVAGAGASIRWPVLNFGIGAPALVELATGLHQPSLTRRLHNLAEMRSQVKSAV